MTQPPTSVATDSDPAKAIRTLEDAMSVLCGALKQLHPQLNVEFSNASIGVYGALELVKDLLPVSDHSLVSVRLRADQAAEK